MKFIGLTIPSKKQVTVIICKNSFYLLVASTQP